MIMALMFLCLAGQTCRGSEEEQGDEGGGLPVDEWHEGTERAREKNKKGENSALKEELNSN